MEYVIMVNGSVVYTWNDEVLARLAYVEYFHNCNDGDVVVLAVRCDGLQSVIKWLQKAPAAVDSEASA